MPKHELMAFVWLVGLGDFYSLEPAALADVDEVLRLYFTVYGDDYPISLGTNRHVMASKMTSPLTLWLVARERKTRMIVSSMVFSKDPSFGIAKAEAAVTHPDFRKQKIADWLMREGSAALFEKFADLQSIYTLTRTLSIAPQILALRNEYLPLGICPNALKLGDFETLALMAKFRPGALARRRNVSIIPEFLAPLLKATDGILRNRRSWSTEETPWSPNSVGTVLDWEVFYAPNYVDRLWKQRFPDPQSRFYPFHEPNALLTSTNGEVEIFAHISKRGGYCTLCSSNKQLSELVGRLPKLVHHLRDLGVAYLELLIPLSQTANLHAALQTLFIPSAYYPAMLELGGQLEDVVVMSRSLEDLDFRGMKIERVFKPYIDQYIEIWKRMHLEVIGVVHDFPL